jgi:hypothetical protein
MEFGIAGGAEIETAKKIEPPVRGNGAGTIGSR